MKSKAKQNKGVIWHQVAPFSYHSHNKISDLLTSSERCIIKIGKEYLWGGVNIGKDTYTEMQLKIINGDIPLDKVGSNILARLRNKAILLNDQDLAQMIEVQLAQNKADSKARNLERAKKY